MTKHYSNAASVQAELERLHDLQEQVKVVIDSLQTYMVDNDLDILKGITLCYDRTWVKDSLVFDSTKFKEENPDLYAKYKTKEKAGVYRYSVKALK